MPRVIFQRLLSFLRRRGLDRDFEEELSAHLDSAAADYIASGMAPDEARRQARLKFGALESAKDLHRDSRGLPFLDNLVKDVRYALRQLGKNATFTLAAVVSLGLGIGATTAVFGVIYGVLLHPYPYRNVGQMVDIGLQDRAGTLKSVLLTGPQFEQFEQARCIESSIAWQNWALPATSSNPPQDVKAVFFTPNASKYFGVPPVLGRELIPSDAPEGKSAQPVVLLAWSFWHRNFNANPSVLGKTLQLLHKNYTVIGVMPERFAWNGGDVYIPLEITDGSQSIFAFSAKLKSGVTLAAADAELQALFERFAKETPARFPASFHVRSRRLIDRYGQTLPHTLLLLFAAVVLLLLIGCANTSILLLARGASRKHELAVRAAIGASRGRIVRQLLTESCVLSFAGASLGVLLAYATVHAIANWLPQYSYPHEAAIGINLPVLVFSVLVALLTSLAFGLSPAFRLSRSELGRVTRAATRNMSGEVHEKRAYTILIACQIALSLLLLSAAGSAADAFARLLRTNLGYNPSRVMDVSIPIHYGSYGNWKERAAYFDQLRQRVAALPEVEGAVNSSSATPPFDGTPERLEVLGSAARQNHEARLSLVDPGYFSLLHTPLLRGRIFNESETMQGARLAVINQTMARQYWPNGDALGRSIRLPELKGEGWLRLAAPHSEQWFQIAGIVGDARNDGLLEPVKPAVYLPYTIWMGVELDMLVRTHISPLSVVHSVRAQIQTVDSNQEVTEYVPTLENLITTQVEWQQEHLVTMLFGAFAILALLLSTIGLYSVVSYSVAQRSSEFGIRMALGAQPGNVFRGVLLSTSRSVGSGIGAGILLAAAFHPLLARWIEDSSRNLTILLTASLLLAVVSVLAGFFPARKAARIDPVESLRCQ